MRSSARGGSGRNETIESRRPISSGRKKRADRAGRDRRAASDPPRSRRAADRAAPRFVVITITRHAEVDEAAERVGQPALAEHAEQEVERGVVGLLDLVEQHDRQRLAADAIGERRAGGRRRDEARDRGAGDELAHVDAHEALGVAEQVARELLGELGLADAGRAREQERADRALRIVEAGLEARDHARGDACTRGPGRSTPRASARRDRGGVERALGREQLDGQAGPRAERVA